MVKGIKCKYCGSANVNKSGWNWRHGVKNAQRYRCRDCGKIFVPPDGKVKEVDNATIERTE